MLGIPGLVSSVAALTIAVQTLTKRVILHMATIDQIAADVTAQTTAVASLSTLITGLQGQIAAALAGTTLPPAVQAKVDAVFAGLEANNAVINAALAANVVPPAPAPTPAPAP